uniref:RICIN domain-containing protein n=1 Tax=Nakamurella sp. TaxID=1869182 RepID=UPI003B3B836E
VSPAATTTTAATTPATTFTLSSAARSLLAGLQLDVGSGTVTGTLTGSVLTVTVGAPAIPFQLPVAGQTVSFTGATMTIDESTKTLTLTANVAATNGLGGSLTVTVAHADTTDLSGTDLTATVDVTGISVLGTTVEVSGSLSSTGGTLAASLTGTLSADAVVADGVLTVKGGSTITLATGTGLSINGTAVLGSGATAFTVAVSGTVKDGQNWSLTVDNTANTADTQAFSPIDGLTISPAFTGSITDTAGAITFDVAGDDTGSWTTGGATLSLTHVEVSNAAVPSGLACPAADPGQIWFDVQGGLADAAAGISGTAQACVVPAAKSFQITANSPTIALPHTGGFSIDNPSVSITGTGVGTARATVAVTAKATLTVTPDSAHTVHVPVTLNFADDGSFTASAGVDLGALGVGTTGSNGTLVLASKQITAFDPTTVGASGDPFTLPAGITLLLNYQPTGAVSAALNNLQLPTPTTIAVRATLSTNGFAASAHLQFGAADQGAKLFKQNTPGGASAYVNDLTLGFQLGAASGTLTVSGSAFVTIPKLYPDGQASQVEVTLGGSLGVSTDGSVSVAIQFDITGLGGPWTDAFGIKGLSVGEVAGRIGVEISPTTAGLPVPTLAFKVDNLQLPKVWNDAIGIQAGATSSLNLVFDVNNPVLGVSIVGQKTAQNPNGIALKPFTIVKSVAGNAIPASLPDSVQVSTAQLLFAPLGGNDATGNAINPGSTLVFDSTIAGVPVHVDGNVAVLPYPTLTADATVGNFAVGPVTLNNTDLKINLSANPANPQADFSFHGGFTDKYTGISFLAGIDEGASASMANAAVSLHIAGGLPQYLQAGADLAGSVSVNGSGASFAASGNASVTVAGQNLGSVPFSYSTTSGALWQQLQGSAGQVAQAFKNAYGWTDAQAAAALNTLRATPSQIAGALQSAYGDGYDKVMRVLLTTGFSVDSAISSVKSVLGAADSQVASTLSQLGYQQTQITTLLVRFYGDADARIASVLLGLGNTATSVAGTLHTVFGDTDRQVAVAFQQIGVPAQTIQAALTNAFGDGQAAIYNLMTSIGSAGSGTLDALAGVFNSGAYSPSSHPWYSAPLLWDVSNGSTADGAPLLQWTWNGGHNQQWYVLPTDGGYAELVNRNSGKCLAAPDFVAGHQLIQVPCTGNPSQQWYLGVYPGQSLTGQTRTVQNRSTGLFADVAGASTTAGAAIDQWYYNGNWNQQWYFGPAVG